MTGYADRFGRGGLNHLVDADALLAECGIDSEEIAWRKDFIGFDREDAERLAALQDLFESHADDIAEDFYENLTAYDQTTEVIGRSEKAVDQLKETQRAYLVTLAGGEYGREYVRNRARIGKLHNLIDMPMKHYIGQYGVYYDLIFDIMRDRLETDLVDAVVDRGGVAADGGATAARGEETVTLDRESVEAAVRAELEDGFRDLLAVLRVINLDMQVVADTYIHAYSQDLQEAVDERERLMREVEEDIEEPIAELNDSAARMADSAEEISDLADEQTGRIREVTGEVSNVSATVEEIASTADQVEATSRDAERLAEEGQESADAAVDAIDGVGGVVEDVADDVDRLQTRVDEIDEIVDVINDIADQTNMLALNASI